MRIKTTVKFILLILFLLIAILVVKYIDSSNFLSLMNLRETFSNYGLFAPIIFILIYILLTIFLVPGTVLTIAAGVLFGIVFGIIYSLIGASVGAILLFILARSLGRTFVSEKIEKRYKKLRIYEKRLEKDGLPTILFLRLVPLFPFNVLNFALGLTKVQTKHYVIGTILGIIPGTFVLVYFGDSITELNKISIILSSLLFILLMFSLKIYKYLKKIRK